MLLRIFRVPGVRGLAGVHPRLALGERGQGVREVVRPLLSVRRAELRDYLQAQRQGWREDSSNENLSFTRNRIRQRLLPLIAAEFGERAIEHMAELAEIARAEEEWAVSIQGAVPGTQYSLLCARRVLMADARSGAGTGPESTLEVEASAGASFGSGASDGSGMD